MKEVLVQIIKDEAVTSSLRVAEVFEKRHSDVLESIKNLVAENSVAKFFSNGTYENRGKEYPLQYMNRDGFTLLAMGFTGSKALKFKLDYIEAFNRMENHIKENQTRLPQSPMEVLKLMFDATEEIQEEVAEVKERVADLEENQVLGSGDYGYIARRIHQRVSEIAKGYGNVTPEQRGELYKDINGGIKRIAGVGSRTQLRTKHYQLVIDFINDWEPSTATKTIVRQMNLLEEVI